MQRVMLTGGSGFVGRACLAALCEHQVEVHILTSNPAHPARTISDETSHASATWHHCSLFDPAAVTRLMQRVQPTHLLHLAWLTTPGLYWTSPQNREWVSASLKLLKDFTDCAGQRAVLTGTCAEYDWSAGRCEEHSTPLQPESAYGQAKDTLRSRLETHAERTGLSSCWARLFFLYGPYGHPARMPLAPIDALMAGRPAVCSAGFQRRDYLHVADAARALVGLLTSDVQGPVNVGSGQAIRVREMVLTAARLLQREHLVQFSPNSSPEAPLVEADIRRLQTAIGFQPDFSLAAGLAHTIDWWKEYSAHAAA